MKYPWRGFSALHMFSLLYKGSSLRGTQTVTFYCHFAHGAHRMVSFGSTSLELVSSLIPVSLFIEIVSNEI